MYNRKRKKVLKVSVHATVDHSNFTLFGGLLYSQFSRGFYFCRRSWDIDKTRKVEFLRAMVPVFSKSYHALASLTRAQISGRRTSTSLSGSSFPTEFFTRSSGGRSTWGSVFSNTDVVGSASLDNIFLTHWIYLPAVSISQTLILFYGWISEKK